MCRTSVIDHQTRARERFANLATEARLHAGPNDAHRITQLTDAVRLGHVTPRDAHQALVALRHTQRAAA